MRYTDAPRRREIIIDHLSSAGYVSSTRLSEELGVSEMTIRRDLGRLVDESLAERVPGGAVLPGPAAAVVPFDERRGREHHGKAAIAALAARQVVGANTVGLDAGTTVAGLVEHLPKGVTVVSHSLPVLHASAARSLEMIALGGSYQPATRSFAGPGTRAAIEHLALDLAIISAVALSPSGLYCTSPWDAETKQLLIRAARRTVVVADRSKISASAPLRFAEWPEVDLLVTDAAPDESLLAATEVVHADAALVG